MIIIKKPSDITALRKSNQEKDLCNYWESTRMQNRIRTAQRDDLRYLYEISTDEQEKSELAVLITSK